MELGAAVLKDESRSFGEAPVLIAGPWAMRGDAVVNPSYFSPRAYADLSAASGDPRWDDLAATSRAITAELSAGGLPPDWAIVSPDRQAERGDPLQFSSAPIADPGNPSAAGDPASGLDAVRVAIRQAESCVPEDRALAAKLWPAYRQTPGRSSYGLDGAAPAPEQHAAALVGAAAAARAAGEGGESKRLLDEAEAWDDEHPSYYGAAWVALGRVMLDSSALGTCG